MHSRSPSVSLFLSSAPFYRSWSGELAQYMSSYCTVCTVESYFVFLLNISIIAIPKYPRGCDYKYSNEDWNVDIADGTYVFTKVVRSTYYTELMRHRLENYFTVTAVVRFSFLHYQYISFPYRASNKKYSGRIPRNSLIVLCPFNIQNWYFCGSIYRENRAVWMSPAAG